MRIRVKIGVLLLMSSPAMAQLPGDRPAPNPHSTRSVVIALNGMIATSQPLASAAGLQVMQEGGNAIDAAITAAAVLAVDEPTMNGIGGDLFAIVHDGETRQLRALNASGRSPYATSPNVFASKSLESIPDSGILSVSVPGVVDGWVELLKHHGTISLERALTPAINYARNGFPVSEVVAHQWEDSTQKLMRDPVAASTFLHNGRALHVYGNISFEAFQVILNRADFEQVNYYDGINTQLHFTLQCHTELDNKLKATEMINHPHIDLSIRDYQGRTALDIASERGLTEIVELIETKIA